MAHGWQQREPIQRLITSNIKGKINRKNKLATANALSKLVHALNPELIKAKCKTWYNKNKASKQIKSKRYYKLNYLQNPQRARTYQTKGKGTFGCDL